MNQNLLIIAVLMLLGLQDAKAQSSYKLTIEIDNTKSNKGRVWVAVYNSAGKWMKNEYKGGSAEISNLKSTITLELPPGNYAISAFHDENNNKKLDTNSIGIPKERYGFSNNPRSTFGPPNYDEAMFRLNDNKRIQIHL